MVTNLAGETPSPEMVAASGSKKGLKPWIAWACLTFVILGMAAAVLVGKRNYLSERVPVAQPPEVLVKTARDILAVAGYTQSPRDSAFGFERYTRYFAYVAETDASPHRWNNIPDLAVQFWYRQSPDPIGIGERWPAWSGPGPMSLAAIRLCSGRGRA